MIRYIKTDVTSVNRGIIAHGVNCQGVMGSGVAKAIKDKFPLTFDKYKRLCDDTKSWADTKTLLGKVMYRVEVEPDLLITANCFTQDFYGKDGKQYANYDAVASCLDDVFKSATEIELPVYMPKIGCGLGGLDWETGVKPIVEKLDLKYPNLYIFICEL